MSTARATHSAGAVITTEEHLAQCAGDVWQARALALAEASHLTSQARWLTAHDSLLARETFTVPSISQPTEHYVVTYDAESEHLRCTCAAGAWGKPCRHVGAVVHWLLQYRDATRPHTAEELQREQAHEDFWQLVEDSQW